jgi:hypothetical protein
MQTPRHCLGGREPDTSRGLEAERKELGAAGGVAIHQGTETDLVGDTEDGEALHHNADHNAEHGGAAVEELNTLELLHVDQLLSTMLQTGGACRRSSI